MPPLIFHMAFPWNWVCDPLPRLSAVLLIHLPQTCFCYAAVVVCVTFLSPALCAVRRVSVFNPFSLCLTCVFPPLEQWMLQRRQCDKVGDEGQSLGSKRFWRFFLLLNALDMGQSACARTAVILCQLILTKFVGNHVACGQLEYYRKQWFSDCGWAASLGKSTKTKTVWDLYFTTIHLGSCLINCFPFHKNCGLRGTDLFLSSEAGTLRTSAVKCHHWKVQNSDIKILFCGQFNDNNCGSSKQFKSPVIWSRRSACTFKNKAAIMPMFLVFNWKASPVFSIFNTALHST